MWSFGCWISQKRESDCNKLEFGVPAVVEFEVGALSKYNPATAHVMDDVRGGGQILCFNCDWRFSRSSYRFR